MAFKAAQLAFLQEHRNGAGDVQAVKKYFHNIIIMTDDLQALISQSSSTVEVDGVLAVKQPEPTTTIKTKKRPNVDISLVFGRPRREVKPVIPLTLPLPEPKRGVGKRGKGKQKRDAKDVMIKKQEKALAKTV